MTKNSKRQRCAQKCFSMIRQGCVHETCCSQLCSTWPGGRLSVSTISIIWFPAVWSRLQYNHDLYLKKSFGSEFCEITVPVYQKFKQFFGHYERYRVLGTCFSLTTFKNFLFSDFTRIYIGRFLKRDFKASF